MTPPDRFPEIEEGRRKANDTGISFFTHFTIIAGGTFALLIPYIQSLKQIHGGCFFLLGGTLLLLSIIFSVTGLYYMRKLSEHLPLFVAQERNKFEKFTTRKEYLGRLALVTYIVGIISVSIFMYFNLPI